MDTTNIICTWEHIFRGQFNSVRRCQADANARDWGQQLVEAEDKKYAPRSVWLKWLRITMLFRPLQSRTFPTEADATAVGSCVDFSCFCCCQLVNAMIPSLIALCWRGTRCVVGVRTCWTAATRAPVDIHEVDAISYFHAFPWCFRDLSSFS